MRNVGDDTARNGGGGRNPRRTEETLTAVLNSRCFHVTLVRSALVCDGVCALVYPANNAQPDCSELLDCSCQVKLV